MAFYIDKIHVKLNTNDAANPKYKKSGDQVKTLITRAYIAVSHVGTRT